MEKLSKYCVCDQVKTKAVINGEKLKNNKSNRFVYFEIYMKNMVERFVIGLFCVYHFPSSIEEHRLIFLV